MRWSRTALPRSSISSSSPDRRLIPGPPERAVGPRRLLRLIAVACVVVPFASRPLASWAGGLPEAAAPVRDALLGFDAAMQRAGLTLPYDTLHAAMQRLVAQPL
jgi:hypothetical protein